MKKLLPLLMFLTFSGFRPVAVTTQSAKGINENFNSLASEIERRSLNQGGIVHQNLKISSSAHVTGDVVIDGDLKVSGDLEVTGNISKTIHMVRVSTPNGFGSGSTYIRRFTTTIVSSGTAITYADSSSLGATFTINEDGIYAITYSEQEGSSTQETFGISVNSTELTKGVELIRAEHRLAIGQVDGSADANPWMTVSWTGFIETGSVVRPHTDAGVDGGVVTNFTIVRVD